MEEMNRRNDQGLGLPDHYTMLFFFCTDFFWKFPGKTSSNSQGTFVKTLNADIHGDNTEV